MDVHPEVAIIIAERKISETRTQSYSIRASRAAIEKGMSTAMRQAETEIALAWKLRTGAMGYASGADLNWVRGQISGRDLDKEHLFVQRLLKWLDVCQHLDLAVVVDLATQGKTLLRTAGERRVNQRTIRRRWHRGLKKYCSMHRI